MSYHDLHITTAQMPRTPIARLPFGYEVSCNRVAGWRLYFTDDGGAEHLIAGEYERDGLVLDVDGTAIVDSLSNPRPDET